MIQRIYSVKRKVTLAPQLVVLALAFLVAGATGSAVRTDRLGSGATVWVLIAVCAFAIVIGVCARQAWRKSDGASASKIVFLAANVAFYAVFAQLISVKSFGISSTQEYCYYGLCVTAWWPLIWWIIGMLFSEPDLGPETFSG